VEGAFSEVGRELIANSSLFTKVLPLVNKAREGAALTTALVCSRPDPQGRRKKMSTLEEEPRGQIDELRRLIEELRANLQMQIDDLRRRIEGLLRW
jgi:hypothetical protein